MQARGKIFLFISAKYKKGVHFFKECIKSVQYDDLIVFSSCFNPLKPKTCFMYHHL